MKSGGFEEAIAGGLSSALGRADQLEWDLQETRAVVFSDLHRGQQDSADDFRPCAKNYARALEFYLGADYTLIVLGDSEDLWEGWPGKVLSAYANSFGLEAGFHKSGSNRFIKAWGNHDDLWRYPQQVAKHLSAIFGEMSVPEGLDVRVKEGENEVGRIFLVHGHQGTPQSDKWGKYSRHVVRWVWRPVQRLLKISFNTPAKSFELRKKHDRAMYDWAAARHDLVLIAGHTHRPVFVGKPHVETLERLYRPVTDRALESVSAEQSEQRSLADREIAWAKAEAGEGARESGGGRDCPCYFNAGCCAFSNGDITGIEVAEGEIRLVRWSTEIDNPADRVLESQALSHVFAELRS